MDRCCGVNEPKWTVRGGRFGEAGNHPACFACLSDVIDWVILHPSLSSNKMVEVRPYVKVEITDRKVDGD